MASTQRAPFRQLRVVYPEGVGEISTDLSQSLLIKRLQDLSQALRPLEQEDESTIKYKGLAKLLATNFFIHHESKEVKLLVACVLADIFKLSVPECPFDDDEETLSEVFNLFIKQFRFLKDTGSLIHKRAVYLLENLTQVKTFSICNTLMPDGGIEIFLKLFETLFSCMSGTMAVADRVKFNIIELCHSILDEIEHPPESDRLLASLMTQIIEPHKSQNPVVFKIASLIIKKSESVLQHWLKDFFHRVMVLGKSGDTELSDHKFDLIYQLIQVVGASSDIILDCLPSLSMKLKSSQESDRKNTLKLLALLFKDQSINMLEKMPKLWSEYLGRMNDIAVEVRLLTVTLSGSILLEQKSVKSYKKDILERFTERQHDPDSKVRNAVVTAVFEFLKSVPTPDLHLYADLFEILKKRACDVDFTVRRTALMNACVLYSNACLSLGNFSENAPLAWVPAFIFTNYLRQTSDDKHTAERLIHAKLFSYDKTPSERVTTFLSVYCFHLDSMSRKAIPHMWRNHVKLVATLRAWLKAGTTRCAELNALSSFLPTSTHPQDQLVKLGGVIRVNNDLQNCFVKLCDPLIGILDAKKEMTSIMKFFEKAQSRIMVACLKYMLERIFSRLWDLETVTVFFETLENDVRSGTDCDFPATDCFVIAKELAQNYGIYIAASPTCLEILVKWLNSFDPSWVSHALDILSSIGKHIGDDVDLSDMYSTCFRLIDGGLCVKQAIAVLTVYRAPDTKFAGIFTKTIASLEQVCSSDASQNSTDSDSVVEISHATAKDLAILAGLAACQGHTFQADLADVMTSVASIFLDIGKKITVSHNSQLVASQNSSEFSESRDDASLILSCRKGTIDCLSAWIRGTPKPDTESVVFVLRGFIDMLDTDLADANTPVDQSTSRECLVPHPLRAKIVKCVLKMLMRAVKINADAVEPTPVLYALEPVMTHYLQIAGFRSVVMPCAIPGTPAYLAQDDGQAFMKLALKLHSMSLQVDHLKFIAHSEHGIAFSPLPIQLSLAWLAAPLGFVSSKTTIGSVTHLLKTGCAAGRLLVKPGSPTIEYALPLMVYHLASWLVAILPSPLPNIAALNLGTTSLNSFAETSFGSGVTVGVKSYGSSSVPACLDYTVADTDRILDALNRCRGSMTALLTCLVDSASKPDHSDAKNIAFYIVLVEQIKDLIPRSPGPDLSEQAKKDFDQCVYVLVDVFLLCLNRLATNKSKNMISEQYTGIPTLSSMLYRRPSTKAETKSLIDNRRAFLPPGLIKKWQTGSRLSPGSVSNTDFLLSKEADFPKDSTTAVTTTTKRKQDKNGSKNARNSDDEDDDGRALSKRPRTKARGVKTEESTDEESLSSSPLKTPSPPPPRSTRTRAGTRHRNK